MAECSQGFAVQALATPVGELVVRGFALRWSQRQGDE